VPRHNEERAFLAPMVPQNHSDSVAPSATLTIPELEQSEAAKRACSCFGLGRYFYDFLASWVDLDQHRQPARTPALPAWAIRENRRKGMRPSGKNGNGKGNVTKLGIGTNGGRNGNHGQATRSQTRPTDGGGTVTRKPQSLPAKAVNYQEVRRGGMDSAGEAEHYPLVSATIRTPLLGRTTLKTESASTAIEVRHLKLETASLVRWRRSNPVCGHARPIEDFFQLSARQRQIAAQPRAALP